MDHKKGIRGILVLWATVAIVYGVAWVTISVYESFGLNLASGALVLALTIMAYVDYGTNSEE